MEAIDHWISGDTLHLPFVVPDEDADEEDVRMDLTGGEIQWVVLDRDGELTLSHNDDGVSINVTDASADEFRIEVDADVVNSLNSPHEGLRWTARLFRITTIHRDVRGWTYQ